MLVLKVREITQDVQAQQGLVWHETSSYSLYNMIDNHPRELGFTRSEHEYTLYLKEDNDGHKLIMSLFVDDMLVIGSNATIIEDIKRERQSMCIWNVRSWEKWANFRNEGKAKLLSLFHRKKNMNSIF